MAQYVIHDQIPDFPVLTSKGETTLLALVGTQRTALLMLRYAGCRVCQYDMLQLTEAYDAIRATSGQVLVVLQSPLSTVRTLQAERQYPFTIISDEQGLLYRALGVESAASSEALGSPSGREKIAQAAACGIVHGAYEGNELQLPAAFVLAANLRIVYAHYGSSAADTPSPSELARLLRSE